MMFERIRQYQRETWRARNWQGLLFGMFVAIVGIAQFVHSWLKHDLAGNWVGPTLALGIGLFFGVWSAIDLWKPRNDPE